MAIGSLSPVCFCESLVWVSETEIVAPAYNPIPNHPAKDNSEKEHPRLFHPAPNLCINGFCCEISKTIDRVSPDRFCSAFPILNIEREAGVKQELSKNQLFALNTIGLSLLKLKT